MAFDYILGRETLDLLIYVDPAKKNTENVEVEDNTKKARMKKEVQFERMSSTALSKSRPSLQKSIFLAHKEAPKQDWGEMWGFYLPLFGYN